MTDLDTRVTRLITDLNALGDGGEHRREVLLERAESQGLGRAAAEEAYDLAREEGLDPAIALALVREGIVVRDLDADRPAVHVSEPEEPEWIDEPPSPERAERERRWRTTFRRVRTRLEGAANRDAALADFAREPDVGIVE